MKTLGIIGGIGPESTIEYYRLIIEAYRERQTGPAVHAQGHAQDPQARSYPSIIINSVDLNQFIIWLNANQMEKFTDRLVAEIERLARAGVDFAVLASNTPHIVFDEILSRSPVPMISIVEATCDEVQAQGLKRVGLFGTRFTMQGRFYPEVFARAGVQLIVPNEEEQTYIHEKYLGELLNNIFRPETREGLLAIVDRLKERDSIEALILGGTELPLILRADEHNGVPFLDTTKIHVKRIVDELLS